MSDANEERKVLHEISQELTQLSEQYPDWFFLHDHVDPETCPREDLMELLIKAPVPSLRWYVFGKLGTRIVMSSHSGSPF